MINLHHFEVLFKATPAPCLILKPDAPHFTICEVNAAYCQATSSSRTDLLGKGIFEAFPENSRDRVSNSIKNLKNSLMTVIATRSEHQMKIQKYDIPIRGRKDFQVKYWNPKNFPVLDERGELIYIMHTVADVTAQVLTEIEERKTRLELLEHQEQYRSLFDDNPDAVFTVDLDGFFLSANEALADMLECPLQEIHKLTFFPFVAGEDTARVIEHFQKAGKGEVQNYHTGARTAKGNPLVVNVTNLPITVNGEIVGVFGIARDITKSVLADQQLRQAEQQLKKIMDSSRDVICIIDDDLKFVKISAACQRLWGYSPQELIGRPYRDLIEERDLEEMKAVAQKLRREGNLKNVENRYRHKDGRMITMSWSAHWDPEEKLSYCVGRDITDEKSAAEQIRNSEMRFKALLRNSTDGLIILDSDGIVREISDTGLKISGYPASEIIGRVPLALVHPDDHARVSRMFTIVLKIPRRVRSFEFRLQNPGGGVKWIEANFQNQLEDQAVAALVMNFRDITERKRVSEELQSSKERYRHLFYHNPMPMWIYDMKTDQFLEVNQAAIEKYGYSAADFSKMTIQDIRQKEDLELLHNFTGNRTKFGSRYKAYWRHLNKNGEIMHVDVTSHQIDYQGTQAILTLALDVTAEVKAEDAIRKAEEVRALIMNSALDAIICVDTDEKITLWNNQAEKIFGWRREEVLGKRLSEYIIPAAFREQHDVRIRRYMQGSKRNSINGLIEMTARDKKGIEFPIELTIVHIKHRDKEFFCAYIRDITERKHHLTALDRSEKRYKALVQEGSDLINILDETGKYLYVSPTYLSQLGHREQELTGRNVFDLIHEDDRSHVMDIFQRLKIEKRAKSRPFRFKDGNGEYRWLESVATNLMADPSINGIVVNSKDITERMDYILAIEQQNSKLREIAWTQSHVVRAPLSRIMGIVNVLTNYPGVDVQRLLDSLLSSAHELDDHVRRIVKSAEQIEK
ncbi:MAG TPA: PAS domain S-box protein [Sphingobacteriaceae bacterium]